MLLCSKPQIRKRGPRLRGNIDNSSSAVTKLRRDLDIDEAMNATSGSEIKLLANPERQLLVRPSSNLKWIAVCAIAQWI